MEECEKNIKGLQEDKQEGQTWADIMDSNEKRTVEEVVENHSRTETVKKRKDKTGGKIPSSLNYQNPRKANLMTERKKMCKNLWQFVKTFARST